MTPGVLWVLAGLAICAVEMVVLPAGGYLLWIGAAACGAGLLTEAADLGFGGTAGAFIILIAVLLGLTRLRRTSRPLANIADDEMLGRTCRAIAFNGMEGRVSVGDGSWAARLSAGTQPPPGTLLRVIGRDGTTLVVAAPT